MVELLVSRIEGILGPDGASVTSPDHIPDKVTGKLREVDASVRFQIGSIPILEFIGNQGWEGLFLRLGRSFPINSIDYD
jgi:hypothetical protein